MRNRITYNMRIFLRSFVLIVVAVVCLRASAQLPEFYVQSITFRSSSPFVQENPPRYIEGYQLEAEVALVNSGVSASNVPVGFVPENADGALVNLSVFTIADFPANSIIRFTVQINLPVEDYTVHTAINAPIITTTGTNISIGTYVDEQDQFNNNFNVPLSIESCQSLQIDLNNNFSITDEQFRKAGTINVSDGNVETSGDLHLQATERIRLLPSFRAKEGSKFKAVIADCGDGPIATTARSGDIFISEPELLGLAAILQVCPNPFADQIYLQASDDQSLNVTIYDLIGREVHREAIASGSGTRHLLQAGSLPDGIYQLVITTETGDHQVFKVQKGQ